jgi:hypothetical protein
MTERKTIRIKSRSTVDRWLQAAAAWLASALRRRGVVRLGKMRRYRRWLTVAVALAAAVWALYSVAVWSESAETCRGCHVATQEVAATHETVRCPACHRPAGVVGALVHGVSLTRMVVGNAAGTRDEADAQGGEQDSACLRCHRSILQASADEGRPVRVFHRHLVEEGMPCGSCHPGLGHSPDGYDRPASIMEKCLRCHDGTSASADCALCHFGEPSDVASGRRVVQPVPIGMNGSCGGCHKTSLEKECVACHGGYEMPHPAGWVEGDHYYRGLVDQDACMDCHEATKGVFPAPHGSATANYGGGFCNRCHTYPTPHGDRGIWIKRHGPVSEGAAIEQKWCIDCHSSEFVQQCTVCHDSRTCDKCHLERDAR